MSQSLQQIKAQAVLMGTHTLGWIAIVVATFSYGSLFVPVKNYDIHDGIVYQWFQCCGILLAGLLQALWRNDWEAPGLSAPGFTFAEKEFYLESSSSWRMSWPHRRCEPLE